MYQRCYNENNKEQFPSTYFSYQAINKLTLMRRDISINVFSISPYKKLGCFHPDIALRKKPILQAIGTDFQAISTVISFATSFNFSLIGARSSRLSRIFLNRTTDFCSVKTNSHELSLLQHLTWFLWFFQRSPYSQLPFQRDLSVIGLEVVRNVIKLTEIFSPRL